MCPAEDWARNAAAKLPTLNYAVGREDEIDGVELAGLMIDHNLGVSPKANYEVKKIDTDYFTE